MRAFSEQVAPAYAGPRHLDVPGRLFPLSSFTGEVAQYFFGSLAPGYDLRPRLAEIGVPTLVAVGRYDWVCPPVAGRILAAGIPDAELVEFTESGHFPFSEEPAAFQAAVGTFLTRVGAVNSADDRVRHAVPPHRTQTVRNKAAAAVDHRSRSFAGRPLWGAITQPSP